MKTWILAAGVAAIAAGAASAQPAEGPRRDRNVDVTRQQAVERADQRFQRLDINNDGRFTPEEARQARDQRRERFAERMFDRLDLDRNGSITREEMSQARAQRQAQRAEHGGDGPAMGRHHRRFMRGHHMGQGMHGARIFGEQGYVTREQMRERALARFDRLDADRNGTLTAAERQQAHERMREHFRERMEQRHPASN